jgi:hypothetical protein
MSPTVRVDGRDVEPGADARPRGSRCFAAPMPSRTITSNARVTLERTTNLDSGRPARLRVPARARPACAADAGRPRRRREGASFLVL